MAASCPVLHFSQSHLSTRMAFKTPGRILPRSQLPQNHKIRSSCRPPGFCQCQNTRHIISYAVNMTAGQSDGPDKINLDRTMDVVRKLWESFPRPVKSFPWTTALRNFLNAILRLVYAVAKCLSIPLLAVSSLSEMSYCAHERKLVVVPFPLLAGIAVAGVLKDTATELSLDLKEGEFPWHLLLTGIFFVLLKLPGPYYPYWGRIFIPHFANGGLWGTLWFAFLWHRRPHEASESTSGAPIDENQSEQKKL